MAVWPASELDLATRLASVVPGSPDLEMHDTMAQRVSLCICHSWCDLKLH
jgi:hypothetical protein